MENTQMTKCSSLTKKGRACPIEADRIRDGRAYCHVHDPNGVYQRQNRGELPRNLGESQAAEMRADRDRLMKKAMIDDFAPIAPSPSAGSPHTTGIDPNWHRPDGCPFEPGRFVAGVRIG